MKHPLKRTKIVTDTSSIEGSLTPPIFSTYPRNATYPAQPALVPREQHLITESIRREVRHSIPSDFTESMANMVLLAQLSTDSMLAAENQSSFNEITEVAVNTYDTTLMDIHMKYAKGLAVGGEVLTLMLAYQLKTAGLIMRTHAFRERPEDLQNDIKALYSEVIKHQTTRDVLGAFNERTRIKMLDRAPGQGGLEAILLSKKADFATIKGRKIVLTVRDRFIVDVRRMPMKWRSALRKLVSTWNQEVLLMHDLTEKDSQNELFERILDLPNPEHPTQTLRNINVEVPFFHRFSTTMYAARAELTNVLDLLDSLPDRLIDDGKLGDL